MDKNKFCISRSFGAILLILVLISGLIVLMNTLTKKTISTNTEASTPKILGGEIAKDGEFPFFVKLIYKGDKVKGNKDCAGALISNEWVLTAAHCVYQIEPKEVEAIIGINHMDNHLKALHYSQIDKIIPHNKFVGNKSSDVESFDIALLHLRDKAKGIPTLSLFDPKGGAYLEDIAYRLNVSLNKVVFMGFGATKYNGAWYSQLRESDYSNMSIDLKKVTASVYKIKNVHISNIYLYDETGSGAALAPGDSGGPAIFAYNSKTYILGINSIVSKSYSGRFFSILSSISHHFKWINEITKKYGSVVNADSGSYMARKQQPIQKDLSPLICARHKTIDACTHSMYPCAWNGEKCIGNY